MPTIVTSAPVRVAIRVARSTTVLAATGVTTETVGLRDNMQLQYLRKKQW